MSEQQDSKTTSRDERGRWLPGQSGNPTGRSRPSRIVREKIAERLDDVLASLFFLIDHGDTSAIKLALERVAPALKPETEPNEIAGLVEATTMKDKADAVIHAVAAGSLDADRAAKILQAITNAAALSELEELKARIAALEHRDLVV